MRTQFHAGSRAALALAAIIVACPGHGQNIAAKVKQALARADQAVAKIIAIPRAKRTFANTFTALDDLSVRLEDDTALPTFMQFVSTNAKEREQSRAADEAISNWSIELGKNEKLYKAMKEYADTKPRLRGEQARFLEFTMRDYRRSGMALPIARRNELKAVQKDLNRLGIEFDKNINEDKTVVPLQPSELPGVPQSVIDRQTKAGDLILLGLDEATYPSVMGSCTNATTRMKVWLMNRRRAPANVSVLEQLVRLRAKAANLLGYKNTVDWMIEERMAKNSQNVSKFYSELEPIVRKKAILDMAEFREFKRKKTGDANADFYPWDYAFYKNQLRKEKYAVDRERVAEYFPMQNVIDGLFSVTQSLYGLEYRDVTSKAQALGLPIWHPDVKLYEVFDKAKGQVIGRFYLDLFPREDKYGHAAQWALIPRKKWANGQLQLPLAALVTNFTKPTADKPSLLPHDEVETFFHEFGHCLHSILTETEYGRFAGTSVARDFVEAPSQMFENWVWQPEVLRTFAKHYKTGEPLPDLLLQGMIAARTLGSGIETQGQLYLGEMDQAYHTASNGEVDTTKVGNEIYEKATLYRAVPGTFFQAAFDHLNGYEGAYYGYLWSLVYAQDMFQRFEQLGVLNPEAGKYYRAKILARGGSMDEMAMLRDYLGRDPKTDAFLRHLGLEPGK